MSLKISLSLCLDLFIYSLYRRINECPARGCAGKWTQYFKTRLSDLKEHRWPPCVCVHQSWRCRRSWKPSFSVMSKGSCVHMKLWGEALLWLMESAAPIWKALRAHFCWIISRSMWMSPGSDRCTFTSPHQERDRALHSHKLLFSDAFRQTRSFSQMNSFNCRNAQGFGPRQTNFPPVMLRAVKITEPLITQTLEKLKETRAVYGL